MVKVDFFTKWVEVSAMSSETKITVSKFLMEEKIERYRYLYRFLMDNSIH